MPPPNVTISDEQHGAAVEALDRTLPILDLALANGLYLLGDRFTVADLNVAAVLSPAKFGRYSFANVARVNDWLRRCFARPAQRDVVGQEPFRSAPTAK